MLPLLGGPIVDTNMKLTIISARDSMQNIKFTLSFIVSHGPPSMIRCVYGSNKLLFDPVVSRETGLSELSREVIRSHYVNSSQPDMTRISIKISQTRVQRTYTCTVTVESRVNINNNMYDFENKGSGSSTASITSK